MARPRGEVRQALADAIERLYPTHGAVTYREAAVAAQVAYGLACKTLENMANAGAIAVAGKEKPAGTTHWHNLYEPLTAAPDDTPQPWGGIEALADVIKGWSPTIT